MTKFTLLLAASLALVATHATGQIVLDNFTVGTQPGEGAAMGTWVGQVTQNATTITVGGTAHDDNGWGVLNLPVFDATGLQFIAVTAQLNPGNAATSFNVQFFDQNLGAQAFSISTASFLTGSMTTVNIPLGPWLTADPTQLNGWTIGGGNFAMNGPSFQMTLDQISLTAGAIPEPGAYAAMAGALALGFAFWRRRQ